MYSFLKKMFHKNIALILIVIWHTTLIIYLLRLLLADLGEGQFRYIGW